MWIQLHESSCRWCGTAPLRDRWSARSADTSINTPDTPMGDIVDSCRVWESHIEVASGRQMGVDRHSPSAVCQVMEHNQSPAVSTGSETHHEGAASEGGHYSVGAGATYTAFAGGIWPPQPVIQERSKLTDMDIMLQNWLPVGAVMEEDISSSQSISESLEGCFSCGALTHTCQTLDESFPFLPTRWQADHIGDKFILRPGLWAPQPTDGKRQLIRGEGLVARISNDYELPVVGEDIPGPAVPNYLGTAWSLETGLTGCGGRSWFPTAVLRFG